jgi:hypothetical protein
VALVTVKARFALKLTKTLTMNDLGKYWKPPATKTLSKSKFKQLKKKNKAKAKPDAPRYNENWRQHWKTI